MKLNDVLMGLLVFLAGLVVMVSSRSFATLPNQAYGANTMPLAVGALGMVTGAAVLVQGLMQRRSGGGAPWVQVQDWLRSPRHLAALAVLMALVVLYILASPLIGFLPAVFLVMVPLMCLGGTRWPSAIVVAAVTAIILQQIFGRLLMVPLPRGIFDVGVF